MGIYNFQDQFVPFVRDGSKAHTIRAERRYPDKPGNTLHLYTRLRRKNCELLARVQCIKVEPIQLYHCGDGSVSVWIGSKEVSPDEKDLLAWHDGFRSHSQPHDRSPFEMMIDFWITKHGTSLAFEGHIIYWNGETAREQAHNARRANTATSGQRDSREEPQQTGQDWQSREDFGPNGDATTPGFFTTER